MSHNQKIKLRYNDIPQAQYNAQQNKFTEILKKSVKDFTNRNSLPTSEIDVHTITKHQHTQKVS